MAYIYKHIRCDKSEVFYVGIGSDTTFSRAFSKDRNNNHWKYIINKTDYLVEIIEDGLTWEETCEREKYWIKFYGRHDLKEGTLVNMTDGGEGTVGKIHSATAKEKTRKNHADFSGKNHPQYGLTQSEITKEKNRQSHLGKKHSEETIKKLKKIKSGENHPLFGKKHSLESIEKNRKSHLGKKHSQESIEKIKAGLLGNTRRLGVKHSEETRKKISESLKNKIWKKK
jgi:hypothetical protein